MKLLADIGATNAQWRMIAPEGTVSALSTLGLNFSLASKEDIRLHVEKVASEFASLPPSPSNFGENVCSVHIYAAGLLEGSSAAKVLLVAMSQVFPSAEFEFASDLLAGARALFGHGAGIAAILGTGSNSCLYDGEKIIENIHPGGFILGDYGSAACLGKNFISDYIHGLVPCDVVKCFRTFYDGDYADIVSKVYKEPNPSAWLGSLAPIIMKMYSVSDYVRALVKDNFKEFIQKFLLRYDCSDLPIGITGSFGLACKEVIEEVAIGEGIRITRFLARPIDGLIEFHKH